MIRIAVCVVIVCLARATPGRYENYRTLARIPHRPHLSILARTPHVHGGPHLSTSSYDSEIIRQEKTESLDGDYDFTFTTSDGTSHSERGTPVGPNGAVVKEGEYSFTYPDGTVAHFKYIADENGFRVSSPNLPQIPEHAQLQIEKAEAEKAHGIFHDGSYHPSSEFDHLDDVHTTSRAHGFDFGPINPHLRRRFSTSRFRKGFPGLFNHRSLRPILKSRFSTPRFDRRFPNPHLIRRTHSRPLSLRNRIREDDIHFSNEGLSSQEEIFDSRRLETDLFPTVPIRHGVPLEVQGGTGTLIQRPLSIRRIGAPVQSGFPRVREFNRVNGVLHPVNRDGTSREIDYQYNLRN